MQTRIPQPKDVDDIYTSMENRNTPLGGQDIFRTLETEPTAYDECRARFFNHSQQGRIASSNPGTPHTVVRKLLYIQKGSGRRMCRRRKGRIDEVLSAHTM